MSYNEAFLEGYMDAINEIKDGDFGNPQHLRFFGTLGGGDIKSDLKQIFGIGNDDTVRLAAMEYAMDRGETFKTNTFGFGGTYGKKGGKLYRQNALLPGGTTVDRYLQGAEIGSDEKLLGIFRHLPPNQRKRIMDQYLKSKKGGKR